jgi:hypothetical protein
MTGKIEVTVTLGDRQVTLAGPEDFVRTEVQRLTNQAAGSSNANSTSGPAINSPTDAIPSSERQLVAEKRPRGHSEMVSVLAYFLAKSGQNEFSADDIRRAYARAGQRPPKVIAQALRDAKNVNDYLEVGSTKGTFRLTTHGQRTVEFDLPRKDRD